MNASAIFKKLGKKILINIGYFFGMFCGKKSHIFFFFPTYHLGGANKVHLDIVKTISAVKTNVIFTEPSNSDFFLYDFKKVSLCHDHSSYIKYYLSRYFLVGYWSACINKNKKAVVFGSLTPFFYVMLPYLKKHIKRIDLTHAFGSGIENYSLNFIKFIDKRIVINKQVLLDYSELYKRNHVKLNYLERFENIENAVMVPPEIKKNHTGHLKILYVGRGDPIKRVHLIGEVASKCSKMNLDCSFTLIGDVENQIIPKNKKYCTFLGEEKDIKKFYKDADVILITSTREGFPLVVMEAMAYGVIPICTNVGGLRFHIKDKENGFLVNSISEGDIVNEIVSQIVYLLSSETKKKEMSRHAYTYANLNFNYSLFIEKYQSLFK